MNQKKEHHLLPTSTFSITSAVCVAATGDRCGEGAVWHPVHRAVYWTDINRFLVHRYTPEDSAVRTWFFSEPVTAVALTASDDTLLLVVGSGALLWQPEGDVRHSHFFQLPGWPHVRCNDARVDPRGSLWIGTMRNNVRPDGSPGEVGATEGILYRIDGDSTISEWQHEIGIANTLVWSSDATKFFFADSLRNRIAVYDYDKATGGIVAERNFFSGFERGLPDGSTIDSDGYLWNCRYGGSCIVRITPDGAVDRVVELPVENPTTCTFGSLDRSTLYVTSAALGGSAKDRLGGCLFAMQTSAQGLPENRFRT